MQPRCPWINEWIKKLWYICTTECYSVIKRNEFESVLVRWMNLEPVIWSEVREKQILYTNTYIWNLEKWYWWIYLQGSSGDADREQTYGHSGGRRGGNELREEHWNIHITKCEIDSRWGFAVWHRELNVVLCNNVAAWGVGCGGRWERGSRGGTYIYTYDWFKLAETNTIL